MHINKEDNSMVEHKQKKDREKAAGCYLLNSGRKTDQWSV